MVIVVKKHIANRQLVLAVCDKYLIGKRFEDNGVQLDLSSGFYDGHEADEKEILSLIGSASIINIIGKESVALAVKSGIIERSGVIKIKSIPHAQCIRL